MSEDQQGGGGNDNALTLDETALARTIRAQEQLRAIRTTAEWLAAIQETLALRLGRSLPELLAPAVGRARANEATAHLTDAHGQLRTSMHSVMEACTPALRVPAEALTDGTAESALEIVRIIVRTDLLAVAKAQDTAIRELPLVIRHLPPGSQRAQGMDGALADVLFALGVTAADSVRPLAILAGVNMDQDDPL